MHFTLKVLELDLSPDKKRQVNLSFFHSVHTFIAIICSGVGADTFGVCFSSTGLDAFSTSPGTNVFTDSFFASSSTSLDENKFLASNLSCHLTFRNEEMQ